MKPNTAQVKLCLMTLVIFALMIESAISDISKDKQECSSSIIGLATCLPYVEGNAKNPTPDCCSGLKSVLKTNKKCLCLVIQDRNDPDLGLTINVTLALGLPSVCKTPANVSECPALLNLDPNSPDAQVFYQYGKASSGISGSPANSPTATAGPGSSPAPAGPATKKSDCTRIGLPWFGPGLEAIVILALSSPMMSGIGLSIVGSLIGYHQLY